MTDAQGLTGYGPSGSLGGRFARLIFDGDERRFEQWQIKFLGYMRLRKLKDTIVPANEEVEVDVEKNAEHLLN